MRGYDFESDESLYRRGFEAAQHPSRRSKPSAEAADELRERHGDDSARDTFRRGYERGLAHRRRLMERRQSEREQEDNP